MTPRLLISAAHKSSGKTTVSLGICAALKERELNVRPFKKGPDYIDPMWLQSASGNACYNLDFYTMSHDEILSTLSRKSLGFDISLIEANKGLYDGMELDGSNSNAALAKITQTPVVLVINTRGISRGIAPLLLGYQAFDPEVNIAGVILNQVGGPRHEGKLRTVVEHYTDIPVLGAIQRHQDLELTERHLGLVPSNEAELAVNKINAIKCHIADQVDLDKIISIASSAPTLPAVNSVGTQFISTSKQPIRLGIIRDAAFGFYYADDLDTFKSYGVELVPIDSLHDTSLPDIDALFIGGGFPETHLEKLHENNALRQAIHTAIENELPAYAECGGLMYLCNNIKWHDKDYSMVGIIPATASMHKKPQGRGYIQLKQSNDHPWMMTETHSEAIIPAHEFHYSSITELPGNSRFAFEVKRGTGIDGQHDGYLYKNLLACYAHQRHTASNPWIKYFIHFVQDTRN